LVVENGNWGYNNSVLKSISVNDSITGRKKNVQGAFEISVGGVLAVINNTKYDTMGQSGALQRRIK